MVSHADLGRFFLSIRLEHVIFKHSTYQLFFYSSAAAEERSVLLFFEPLILAFAHSGDSEILKLLLNMAVTCFCSVWQSANTSLGYFTYLILDLCKRLMPQQARLQCHRITVTFVTNVRKWLAKALPNLCQIFLYFAAKEKQERRTCYIWLKWRSWIRSMR